MIDEMCAWLLETFSFWSSWLLSFLWFKGQIAAACSWSFTVRRSPWSLDQLSWSLDSTLTQVTKHSNTGHTSDFPLLCEAKWGSYEENVHTKHTFFLASCFLWYPADVILLKGDHTQLAWDSESIAQSKVCSRCKMKRRYPSFSLTLSSGSTQQNCSAAFKYSLDSWGFSCQWLVVVDFKCWNRWITDFKCWNRWITDFKGWNRWITDFKGWNCWITGIECWNRSIQPVPLVQSFQKGFRFYLDRQNKEAFTLMKWCIHDRHVSLCMYILTQEDILI